MKSLQKAEIYIWFDSKTSATHLFQGICNVRSLRLNIHEVIPLTSRFPILHNLIEFEFFGKETWLVEFLHCAPNLKTLTVLLQDVAGTRWNIEAPSCLSFHLKKIKISDYTTDMIEIVRYLLDNSMVLEKLIIRVNAMNATRASKARSQLLPLLKSSKKGLIVIL
ncbi:hypothetical protein Goshw_028004 [Gossypium schwendimanii]|uniref:FBD domain-containing protein n=1 Tax=Gossypium schwendimanii TaxID=34291 RepID=A0A7J9N3D3_GOSSC|nr:hypothetical protein [Gossypium schwendimanii]